MRAGDRVAGVHAETIAAARAQATEVVVPAADVARLPPRLSLDRAAAVPLSALTARQGLDLLRPDGGRLLVTGGAGSIGSWAIALATRDGRTTEQHRAVGSAWRERDAETTGAGAHTADIVLAPEATGYVSW